MAARRRYSTRLSDLWIELKARRAGQRALRNSRSRAVHDVAGPLGIMFSSGWDALERGAEAFDRSFDPRIPPSLHISHRDAQRLGQPMPLAERCIEDWGTGISYPDPREELDLS